MSDSQRLRAIIEGDAKGAVRAFEQVSTGAEKMGRDVDTAAKKSGRSLKDFQQAGAQAGQGLALLGGAFALASREVVANEQAIRTLERGYGDAADVLRDFADEIQRTTTFSNESAITAANTFRVLADNYGFTTDQIQSLIQVSADLAATQGIDLNEAATRVAAAMRGEAESAEFLGLTLNDSALGIDHLAKSTTDAEKSQIRYNALLDQSAFAQGAAAERAATTAGQTEQLANRVQDATQRFVQFTGPIGESVGALGSFGLEAGLAAGGLVQLGRGLATAAPLVTGLATGPVGLGVLAAGAIAAGAAFLILRDDASAFEEGVEAAAAASDTLREAIDRLAAAGDSFALRADAVGIQLQTISAATIQQATQDLPALNDELQTVTDRMNAWELQGAAVRSEMEANGFVYEDTKARIAELTAEVAEAEGAAQAWADAELSLADIFDSSGPGRDAAITNVLVLIDAYNAQTAAQKETGFTATELAEAITATGNNVAEYDRRVIAATESTKELGAATETTSKSIGVLFTGTKELSDRLKDYEDGGVRAARAQEEWNRHLAESAEFSQAASERLREYEERVHDVAAITPTVKPPALEMETTEITAVTIELTAQQRAYQQLTTGILRASEANAVFKLTQDDLIASQSVYSQQQSEYGGQLNALQEAEDLLNERRAAGVALNAEQVDFLGRVDAAQARLTGGVEDATLAEGNLALQYAENMSVGDQLNENMRGQQEVTGQLVEIVKALILALDGVPDDVKAQVSLIGAETAIGQAQRVTNALLNIPRNLQSNILVTQQLGPAVGPGGLFGLGLQHGGVVPHAQHGLVTRDTRQVIVGESGPELATLPGGTHISPSPASRLSRGAGGGNVVLNNPVIYLYPATTDVEDAFRSHFLGMGR